MNMEDMIDLARRSRESAERAQREAAFWQSMIEQRVHADAAYARYRSMAA